MSDDDLLPLGVAASVCHVPAAWLRREAEAGRLPSLRAGARLIFHIPTIRRILAERAARTSPDCTAAVPQGAGDAR